VPRGVTTGLTNRLITSAQVPRKPSAAKAWLKAIELTSHIEANRQ
jgi:hypothetical protein